MDIRCTTCGEPWDVFTLADEGVSPKRFAAEGCKAFGSRHGGAIDDEKLMLITEMTYLLGDDVDGLAAELEDAEYLGFL